MGALCGKESQASDPFSQPGRTVGSAPAPQSRASVPKISGGQGQALGGSSSGGGGGGGGGGDARSAAAKAAEERAKKTNHQPKGKLGRDLAAQKGQTRTGTLEGLSVEEKRRREIDASDQAIRYS